MTANHEIYLTPKFARSTVVSVLYMHNNTMSCIVHASCTHPCTVLMGSCKLWTVDSGLDWTGLDLDREMSHAHTSYWQNFTAHAHTQEKLSNSIIGKYTGNVIIPILDSQSWNCRTIPRVGNATSRWKLPVPVLHFPQED